MVAEGFDWDVTWKVKCPIANEASCDVLENEWDVFWVWNSDLGFRILNAVQEERQT